MPRPSLGIRDRPLQWCSGTSGIGNGDRAVSGVGAGVGMTVGPRGEESRHRERTSGSSTAFEIIRFKYAIVCALMKVDFDLVAKEIGRV